MKDPKDLDAYLADCVTVEPAALEEEFVRLPADVAFWGAKYAAIFSHWLDRKQVVKQVEAALVRQARDNWAGDKKPTVSEVDSWVLQQPEFRRAQAEEDAAEAEKVRLSMIMEALRTKRECLISLGAHIRHEQEMHIRARTSET